MDTARKGISFVTEYQRHFSQNMYQCSSMQYANNRNFCRLQKNRHQRHIHEPFEWEDDYVSDDVDEWNCEEGRYVGGQGGGLGVGTQKSPFVARHHIKHERWNRLYRERLLGPQHKQSQTDSYAQSPPTEVSHMYAQTDPEDDDSVVVHVVDPSHYECDFFGFRNQWTQTPSSWWLDHRPPFANYGSLDSETTTGSLRTHNVKASRQVYPSAMQAMKIKRRQNLRHASSSFATQTAAEVTAAARRNVRSLPVLVPSRGGSPTFEERYAPSSVNWQSEYNLQYQPYEKSQYHVHIERPLPPRHFELQPTNPAQLRDSYLTVC